MKLKLARELEAQEILYREILEACNTEGVIGFEKLNEMPYLDACIHGEFYKEVRLKI